MRGLGHSYGWLLPGSLVLHRLHRCEPARATCPLSAGLCGSEDPPLSRAYSSPHVVHDFHERYVFLAIAAYLAAVSASVAGACMMSVGRASSGPDLSLIRHAALLACMNQVRVSRGISLYGLRQRARSPQAGAIPGRGPGLKLGVTVIAGGPGGSSLPFGTCRCAAVGGEAAAFADRCSRRQAKLTSPMVVVRQLR